MTEIVPDSYLAWRNLGGILSKLGRMDEAVSMTERSITIRPTAQAYSNLGTIRFFQGRYEDAARRYEQALELDGSDKRLWWNAADAWRLTGRAEKASQAYAQAIRLIERDLSVEQLRERLSELLRHYVPPAVLPTPVAEAELEPERRLAPPKLERAEHD